MKSYGSASSLVALSLLLCAWGASVAAQEAPHGDGPIHLILDAGRPIRVAVAERIRVKTVGQIVNGTVAESIYAYDRMVVPSGTKVHGHIDGLIEASQPTRYRGILSGDFSPPRAAVLQFDTLVFDDGREMKIDTLTTSATVQPTLEEAGGTPTEESSGFRAAVGRELTGEVHRLTKEVNQMKKPGRLQRLKYGLIARLPFHPQYLPPATVYTATLKSPVDFGEVTPLERATEGTRPPPDSILHARLVTPLHSARTLRGSPVEAVLTRPLLSGDNRLILPEGARFRGEVTFAKSARSFHRNGQLRFLFETVQAPARAEEALRGSLHSVEAGGGNRVALDEEGGVSITNSKARFVAPAVAGIALGITLNKGLDYNTDGGPPEVRGGLAQSNGVGGFIGLGFLGMGLAQVSRPLSVAVGIFGAAKSGYNSVFGKGRDISFPDGTVIAVRLAPEPGATK